MPDRLHIGIDGYNLALPHGTGVASYGRVLAGALNRAGHRTSGLYGIAAGRDEAMRELLFFDRLGNPPVGSIEQRRAAARRRLLRAINPLLSARAHNVPMTGRVDLAPLTDRLPAFDTVATADELFPLAMRHFGLYGRFLPVRMPNPPAVMHWTYPLPIVLRGARNIYTLHDLVPLRLPFTTLDRKARYRALLAGCIGSAAAICTVSEASKADIVREFQIDPAMVVNTWQASPVRPSATSAEEDGQAIEGIFGLPREGYFLFLGAIEPKKNVGRLIEAYLALSSKTPLVIVGGKGWQSEAELALLQPGPSPTPHDRRLDARVRLLGHQPRALLDKLIRGARAVLFPSLYEGFGLPVLEAMQLGTPVLTSNVSSLPEVAGDAALLVDPYDSVALAAAIRRLDQDGELRARLSNAGQTRSRAFSKAAYVQRLEALYKAALAKTAA